MTRSFAPRPYCGEACAWLPSQAELLPWLRCCPGSISPAPKNAWEWLSAAETPKSPHFQPDWAASGQPIVSNKFQASFGSRGYVLAQQELAHKHHGGIELKVLVLFLGIAMAFIIGHEEPRSYAVAF